MEKLKGKTPGRSFSGWRILTLVACVLLTPAAGLQIEAVSASIRLRIEGINSNKGEVRISLFNAEGEFPSDSKKAVNVMSVPAKKGMVQAQLDNLPTGTYAIALLHDENQNGQLDTNIVGYPKVIQKKAMGLQTTTCQPLEPQILKKLLLNWSLRSRS